MLAEATKDDAFTLWHLLTREGIQRGDCQMLDRWWDQLGLGRHRLVAASGGEVALAAILFT